MKTPGEIIHILDALDESITTLLEMKLQEVGIQDIAYNISKPGAVPIDQYLAKVFSGSIPITDKDNPNQPITDRIDQVTRIVRELQRQKQEEPEPGRERKILKAFSDYLGRPITGRLFVTNQPVDIKNKNVSTSPLMRAYASPVRYENIEDAQQDLDEEEMELNKILDSLEDDNSL